MQPNSASDLHEIVVDECSVSTPTDSSSIDNNSQEPSKKRLKMDASMVEDALEETWLKLDKAILQDCDKTVIQNGQRLNDRHINFAQVMLRRQFPHLEGLKLTLLQEKSQKKIQNELQIIFCSSRKHWIVASTIACSKNEVKVYDSVFNTTDAETRKIICNVFNLARKPKFTYEKFQKQIGPSDCRLFTIAAATALALGLNPVQVQFQQAAMRNHLLNCFEKGYLEAFPAVH